MVTIPASGARNICEESHTCMKRDLQNKPTFVESDLQKILHTLHIYNWCPTLVVTILASGATTSESRLLNVWNETYKTDLHEWKETCKKNDWLYTYTMREKRATCTEMRPTKETYMYEKRPATKHYWLYTCTMYAQRVLHARKTAFTHK